MLHLVGYALEYVYGAQKPTHQNHWKFIIIAWISVNMCLCLCLQLVLLKCCLLARTFIGEVPVLYYPSEQKGEDRGLHVY